MNAASVNLTLQMKFVVDYDLHETGETQPSASEYTKLNMHTREMNKEFILK